MANKDVGKVSVGVFGIFLQQLLFRTPTQRTLHVRSLGDDGVLGAGSVEIVRESRLNLCL